MRNLDWRRRLACWLMESSLRFAPLEAQDWGRAMRAELDFVQTSWEALGWAAGGARVLWQQAFFSLFRGSRGLAPGPSRAYLPVEEGHMHKSVFVTAVACVIASLLFFLAPSFHQALGLSLQTWAAIFRRGATSQADLNSWAAQAEKRHDAKLLAFVALIEAPYGPARHFSAWEAKSLRLAEDAVQLDPRLTWIYAGIAAKNPAAPECKNLIERVHNSDPDNAMPDLLMAARQKALLSRARNDRLPPGALAQDPKWLRAMKAAFSAEKYDSYFNRRVALVQDVARRRKVNDPLLLATTVSSSPLPDLESIRDYARHLIQSGQALEAGGETGAASQRYWQGARFGQIMRLGAETDLDRIIAHQTQAKAYEHLRELDLRQGNQSEANLLSYRLQALALERQDLYARNRERMDWRRTYGWIASCVQVSAMALLAAGSLVVIACFYWLVRRWGQFDPAGRLKPLFSWLGILGAAGGLASSAGLYLSYRPYAELLNHFIVSSGVEAYFSLDAFLTFLYLPSAMERALFAGTWAAVFWYAVIFLCVAVLVAILARHAIKPLRPKLAG